jgi:hypothetical protein
MKNLVGPIRYKIFFGKHFQRIGNDMEQAQCGKPHDVGTVGPDAILHERTLLSLYPGQDGGKKTNGDCKDEKDFNQRND